MTRLLVLALLALAFVVGCDDDDPVSGTDPFLVRIVITDSSGAPVQGLQISVAPDLPEFYQDDAAREVPPGSPPEDGGLAVFPSPFYPITVMEFTSVETSTTRLTVEDIDGRTVDVPFHVEQQAAGQFRINWNGEDSAGGSLPGGVYFAHLVLESNGQVRHEERVPMLYVPLYPDQYSIGVTDSRGRLNIIDGRHFPQLYELPPVPARDGSGAVVGTIEFGPAMRFHALDPGTGDLMRFDREVSGSCELKVVWEPQPRAVQ